MPGMELGILADEVLGLKSVAVSEIQHSLPTLKGIREEFLQGVTRESLVLLDAKAIVRTAARLAGESDARAQKGRSACQGEERMKISRSVGTKIGGGFGLALVILMVTGGGAYRSTRVLISNFRWVVHTDEVMMNLERLFSLAQDAETGQRGFVITGKERYLAPYNDALPRVQPGIGEIKKLGSSDNPNQQRRIEILNPLVAGKLAELQTVIDLRRAKGFEPAMREVSTDKGKKTMDGIRSLIGEMEGEERQLLQHRTEESEASAQNTRYTIIFGTLTAFVLLGTTSFMITRNIAVPLRRASLAADAMGCR